jgi:hypothetical protein
LLCQYAVQEKELFEMSIRIEATGNTIDEAFAALASDPRVLQRVSTDTLIRELAIRVPRARLVAAEDEASPTRTKRTKGRKAA